MDNGGPIDFPFENVDAFGDENKKRGNWSLKLDFLVASLGFSIGCNSLWRFPYYCYIHGGATFLIPYIIVLVLAALPLFLMELVLGQFSSLGCISVWQVCPLFKGGILGASYFILILDKQDIECRKLLSPVLTLLFLKCIGIATFIVACFLSVFLNLVSSWSIFYVIASLRSSVPWSVCNPQSQRCLQAPKLQYPTNCTQPTIENTTQGISQDSEYCRPSFAPLPKNLSSYTLPSDEYFHNHVLAISSGIDSIGTIQWQLAMALLIAWLLIFFCSFQGIKTSGKVVYVTTVLPFVILLVLLVHSFTLPGSANGVLRLLYPDVEKLLLLDTWGDAAIEAFYSLSVCWGVYMTMASYNRFHNNCFRDMWLISISSTLASVFFAVVVFAAIGFLAHETHRNFEDFVTQDPGMVFVVYAEALARLPVAPVWSVFFFIGVMMLGIHLQIFVIETIVTAICDEFPERLRKNHRHVLALTVVIFAIAGVPLCTQAGYYIYRLLDTFVASWSVLIIGFFKCFVISWVYGIDNLLENIKWMVKFYPRPYVYWKITWKFVTPTLLMAMILYSWFAYRPLSYDAAHDFPDWANWLGWAISFLPISAIPIAAFYQICSTKGAPSERFRYLLCPADEWGPALAVHRAEIFPVDIIEARQPLKLDLNNGTSAERLSSVDEENSSLMFAAEGEEPKFDRETVI